MYVRITRDEHGKKKPFFGKTWGSLTRDEANATAFETGNGVIVIDIDTKDMNLIDQRLVAALPDMPTVETARGYHYYFNVDDDSKYKTVSNVFKGVDMRANGGVVFNSYWGSDDGISYDQGRTENYEMTKELEGVLMSSELLKKSRPIIPKNPVTEGDNELSIDDMREVLSFIDPDEDYDRWIRVGMALKSWDEAVGFNVFDEWSRGGGLYRADQETQYKWESFKSEGIGVGTIFMMAKEAGFAGLSRYAAAGDDMPFEAVEPVAPVDKVQKKPRPRKKSKKEQAAESLAEWAEESGAYIFFNKGNEKYCISRGDGELEEYTKASFLQVLYSDTGADLGTGSLMVDSLVSDYAPNEGTFYMNKDAQRCVNIFRSTRLMEETETGSVMPKYISLLFESMFEDAEERVAFLNWLAYIYQFRTRTNTAYSFVGISGSGKGVLVDTIIKGIFGHNIISNLTDMNLESQFNGLIKHKLFVHFNELSTDNKTARMSVKNRLKTWITDDTLVVNEKGTKEYEVSNHCNIIINSNEAIPFDLDEDDRRFNVVHTKKKLVDNDWFVLGDTVENIKNELLDFAKYLRGYDVDQKAVSICTMSERKEDIINSSKVLSLEIAEAFRDGDFDFFMDAGIEEWLRTSESFTSIDDIREEFKTDFIKNRTIELLVSAAFGKKMHAITITKIIFKKHGVGKRDLRKINGNVVRGIIFEREGKIIDF